MSFDEPSNLESFDKLSFDDRIIFSLFRNFDWIIFVNQFAEYTIFHSKNIF